MWQEIKTLLEAQTGLVFSAINALAPLPSASYSIQTTQHSAVSEGLLSIRVYTKDHLQLIEYEKQLIDLLNVDRAQKGIETPNYYIRSRLSSSIQNEIVEQGLYDLAISFILKWKEKE